MNDVNKLHYPDLERSKKLTELGFPKTEHPIDQFGYIGKRRGAGGAVCYEEYVCPSVMEMMDVIPDQIEHNGEWLHLAIVPMDCRTGYQGYEPNGVSLYTAIDYETFRKGNVIPFSKEIPNTLADLIIWLIENEHISFK